MNSLKFERKFKVKIRSCYHEINLMIKDLKNGKKTILGINWEQTHSIFNDRWRDSIMCKRRKI